MQTSNSTSNKRRSSHLSRLSKSVKLRVVSHRARSKAAEAHLYVRANRERPRSEVVQELQRKFKLTESTARNWFQTYKTSLPDITPRAQ